MRRKGITFKIFSITSILLVVSALIIYLTFYFLLPNYYYSYKKDHINEGVSFLIEDLKNSSVQGVDNLLNDFVQEYNVRLIIHNHSGYLIYFPVDRQLNEEFNSGRFHLPGRNSVNRRIFNEEWNSSDVISISEPFRLVDDPNNYEMTVTMTLQPIDEAAKVILLFLPYMLIVIGVISVVGAYFYSNLLSKPLIKLNLTAKKMAQLDFSTHSKIDSKDELGELSKSLNQLSTNLKKNMDELQEANLQLKDDIQKEREQEAKRREFIATISHELKTPITAVSGQLEGMIHEIGTFKDRDKYLKQSYDIMKEMEKLVHEILDISRLDSFDLKPNLVRLNFSSLLTRTLEQFSYQLLEKNLSILTSITPNLYIVGDEKLISKAVSNVLSNAIKYSPEGELIEIKLVTENELLSFEVLNSGAFIDESQLNKIFEPFYRIEKSRNRKTGGSGLGLYIVKRILNMHKFSYSINNVPTGVVFKIEMIRCTF